MSNAYSQLHNDIKKKEKRLVEVTKISYDVSLTKTILECYPQAVVAISLLMLSVEYPSIRSWLTQNLNNQFSRFEIVFCVFLVKTVFGLVTCVINNR